VRYFKVLAFAVPYILLMLYLIISEPMIIGTYFLGGLLGLIILLCMLIWASGLRESILWGDQAGGDQGERADMELRESWERYNQSLRISVRGRTVTRAKIINVFNDFDSQYPDTRDYDDWLNKTKYHSAVRYTGKLYPPKKILSMAANIPLRRAPVGEEANQVFRELGFDIVNK
jgi:hypothetical protein